MGGAQGVARVWGGMGARLKDKRDRGGGRGVWAEGRDPGVPHPVPHPTENLWPRPPEPGLGVGPGGAEDEDDDSSFGVLLGLSLPTASGECRGGEHPPPPPNPGVWEGTRFGQTQASGRGRGCGEGGTRPRGCKEGTPASGRGTCAGWETPGGPKRGPRHRGGGPSRAGGDPGIWEGPPQGGVDPGGLRVGPWGETEFWGVDTHTQRRHPDPSVRGQGCCGAAAAPGSSVTSPAPSPPGAWGPLWSPPWVVSAPTIYGVGDTR